MSDDSRSKVTPSTESRLEASELPRRCKETLAIVQEVKEEIRRRLQHQAKRGTPAADPLIAQLRDPRRISDYAVAQVLRVTQGTVSKWRQHKGGMADETAISAADFTHANRSEYLLRVLLERARTVAVADEIEKLLRLVKRGARRAAASILLSASVLVGLCALPSQDVAASQGPADSPTLRLMSHWRRWLRQRFGLHFLDRRSVTAPAF